MNQTHDCGIVSAKLYSQVIGTEDSTAGHKCTFLQHLSHNARCYHCHHKKTSTVSKGETAVEGSVCSSNQPASTVGLTTAVIILIGWMIMLELEDFQVPNINPLNTTNTNRVHIALPKKI